MPAKSTVIQDNYDEIKDLVDQELTLTEIARRYKISRSTLSNYFKSQSKPETRWLSLRKRSIDMSFFLDINTQDKAYVVGLLLADGTITECGGIRIESKDRCLCSFVQTSLRSDATVKKLNRPGRNETYLFEAKAKQMLSSMRELGLVPNKTEVTKSLPSISADLQPHLIRGIFDGDGTVGRYGTSGCKAAFIGMYDMLCSVKAVLKSFGVSSWKIHRSKSSRACRMGVSSRQLGRFIYPDGCALFLPRKRNIFFPKRCEQ